MPSAPIDSAEQPATQETPTRILLSKSLPRGREQQVQEPDAQDFNEEGLGEEGEGRAPSRGAPVSADGRLALVDALLQRLAAGRASDLLDVSTRFDGCTMIHRPYNIA